MINVNDVRAAAYEVVHTPASLKTSQYVGAAQADPMRRLDYQNHPQRRRMYTHPEHRHPSNLTAIVLDRLGLPMPPVKKNEDPFTADLHLAYQQKLTDAAVKELRRIWDADAAGQHWVEIVPR